MNRLYIEPTGISPEIDFSPADNRFIIRGNSAPEDVRALYYPVIEWLGIFVSDVIEGEYRYSHDSPLLFQINLHYFNSSSAKYLFDIFMELKKLSDKNIPLLVEWHYDPDDSDQKDAGEDIALLAGMEFRYIEIKPDQQ